MGSRVLSLIGSSKGSGPLFGANGPRNCFVSNDLHPVEEQKEGHVIFQELAF